MNPHEAFDGNGSGFKNANETSTVEPSNLYALQTETTMPKQRPTRDRTSNPRPTRDRTTNPRPTRTPTVEAPFTPAPEMTGTREGGAITPSAGPTPIPAPNADDVVAGSSGDITTRILLYNANRKNGTRGTITVFDLTGAVVFQDTVRVKKNMSELVKLPASLGGDFSVARVSAPERIKAVVLNSSKNTARDAYEAIRTTSYTVTLPLLRHLNLTTQNTIIAVQNASDSTADTIFTVYDKDGVEMFAEALTIPPYASAYLSTNDLFPTGTFTGSVGNELVDLGYDRATVLHRLRYVSPASSFRSQYAHSNAGIAEGAFAAAKPTGKPWEDISAEKIYTLLGMISTSSRYDDFLARPNRAAMHTRVGGKWAPAVKVDPDELTPAYGVSSNAKDLAEWVRLQLGNGKYEGKQLISEEALAQTRLPTILNGINSSGKPTWYGLGWDVSYNEDDALNLSHAGAFTQGSRTSVRFVPAENWGIVVLTNSFPQGLPEGIAATFYDVLHYGQARRDYITAANQFFDAAFGPQSYAPVIARYAHPPSSPAPALPNSAYVGTYTNDFVGDVLVTEKDGGLAIQQGPNKLTFPLKHFDQNLYIYYPYAEIPDYPSGVNFTIGPDQKAIQVTIDNLNSDGQGVLTRVIEVP